MEIEENVCTNLIIESLFPDSRWVSGAGGLLLGLDLTQADIQADYSCVALDIPSPPLKLTTDGKFTQKNRLLYISEELRPKFFIPPKIFSLINR